MIDKVRIQNLKSIVDSGEIDIKPLTVVIGKNSSGKSTLLRLFPLMKQSFLYNMSEPIMWFHNYVDFGSFKNALNSNCDKQKDTINFEFSFDKPTIKYSSAPGDIKYLNVEMKIADHVFEEIRLTVNKNNDFIFKLKDKTKLSYVLFLNGEKSQRLSFAVLENGRSKLPVPSDPRGGAYFYPSFFRIPRDIIEKYCNDNSDYKPYLFDGTALSLKEKLTFDGIEEEAKQFIKEVSKTEKEIENEDIKRIARSLFNNLITEVLSFAQEVLANTFSNVQYFQPLRARGDRFYRVQGLSTREIDSDGVNGPMYLFNMSTNKRRKFEEWCLENFGFTYAISEKGDSAESTSVVVKTSRNDILERNLTDVGFGYSQIFPIILALWNDSNNATNNLVSEKIYVIEQPELHLHPAFQKKIMKAIFDIIRISKNKKTSVKFLIETHSETIVNYIGKSIFEYGNSDDVNLLICDKTSDGSYFEKMNFNNDGTIKNWPIGFFSDEE